MNKKTKIIYIVTLYFSNIASLFAVAVTVANMIDINIYGSTECGMTNNRALYATFGYERAIHLYTCYNWY